MAWIKTITKLIHIVSKSNIIKRQNTTNRSHHSRQCPFIQRADKLSRESGRSAAFSLLWHSAIEWPLICPWPITSLYSNTRGNMGFAVLCCPLPSLSQVKAPSGYYKPKQFNTFQFHQLLLYEYFNTSVCATSEPRLLWPLCCISAALNKIALNALLILFFYVKSLLAIQQLIVETDHFSPDKNVQLPPLFICLFSNATTENKGRYVYQVFTSLQVYPL